MKKHGFYIVMIIVAAIVLSSCGKGNKIADTPKGPVNLTFSTFYEGESQVGAYKEIISAFEASHNDIKINLVSGAVDYDKKISDALTKDNGPDVIGLQRSRMVEYAKQGIIKDISSWVESNGVKDKYFGVSLGYGKYDGKYYGIGDMPETVEWYYNVDMFKKLNLSEPKNLTELINDCSKLKKYTRAPIMVGAKDPWAVDTMFGMITTQSMDINEFNKAFVNGDKQKLEDLQGANDAVNVMGKLIDSGALHYSITDYDYAASVDAFVKGKTAILPMGSWAIDKIDKSKPKNFNYKSFEEPVMFTQNPYSKYSATAVQVITVNKKSKHEKEAMEFMDFLFGEEAQKIFAQKNGISGLKSVNTEPKSEVKKQVLKHLESTDENSTMYIDNVSDKMMEATGKRLLQLIEDDLKTSEAWQLIVSESMS